MQTVSSRQVKMKQYASTDVVLMWFSTIFCLIFVKLRMYYKADVLKTIVLLQKTYKRRNILLIKKDFFV